MVSFPTNPTFLDRLAADAEAVRLDAILPDVLRRYGLEPGASPAPNVPPLPSRSPPPTVWLPIADNHSFAAR